MPPYSKTTWVDGSLPAIDASKLNKIEQGIFDSLRQDGSTTMSGQLVTTAGSASTPAIAPTGDSNTGIFFPAADTIAFGEGGAEAMRITSTGNVGIGDFASNPPPVQFSVSSLTGGVVGVTTKRASGTNASPLSMSYGFYGYLDGEKARITATERSGNTYASDLNFQVKDSSDVLQSRLYISTAGNVGIGTTSPNDKLEVSGGIRRTQVTAGSNASPASEIGLQYQFDNSSNRSGLYFHNTYSNNGAAWMSFWTSNTSNVFAERMRIDAAGNVGIGVNPNVELHVKGTGEILRLETTAATGDNFIRFYAPSATTQGYVGYTSAANNNMSINQVLNNDLLFFTNNTERMRIQNSGGVIPSANNTYELGSATFRWSTIYAQNALNTSDARLKTNVEPSSLGLDFINQLNPVQYRWIEGGNTVDKVQIETETVEITPAIPAQPEVMDEEGNIIQEAIQEVPAVTEERPVYETVVTPREGVRTHFGLIAQEVKAALPDGLDFAGWCLADKDDPNSTQSLGYTQLIAPMIKAIQELKAEIEALKVQLNK